MNKTLYTDAAGNRIIEHINKRSNWMEGRNNENKRVDIPSLKKLVRDSGLNIKVGRKLN